MSRSLFHSYNKVGETMSFQTNSSSSTTFSASVTFLSGSDRVSWNLGDGSGYQATNSLGASPYTYSDGGITKTVTIRTNRLSRLNSFNAANDHLVGHLDMSKWNNLGFNFNCFGNSELTGITHTASTQVFANYRIDGCNIIGELDLSMLSGLGGLFFATNNSSLTNILHTYSPQVFSSYRAFNCDLTGNLNLPFPNLGGNVYLRSNFNLTGVTHTASTQNITVYQLHSCNIIGNHSLPFSNLGGQFYMLSNPNLTGITHTASDPSAPAFTWYQVNSCNLKGTHDMSMLTNLGGRFQVDSNSNLTNILHGSSTEVFTNYLANNCNLTGTLDLSMLTGLGGQIRLEVNSNLTNISFPATEGTFANVDGTSNGYALSLHECNLEYVNFLPLSGANMDVDSTFGATINLNDQLMHPGEVNHILEDFANMANNLNPDGWTGVTLHIAGNNAAPDANSGGYEGLVALDSLTGSPNNWTITTS